MNDFNGKGFLGDQIIDVKNSIFTQYKGIFLLAQEVNEFIIHEVDKFKFYQHQEDIVIGTLFSKIITSYQAIIIILNHGLPNEACVLLRSLMESTFLIIASCKDENFYKDYIKSHHYQRMNLLKNTINSFSKDSNNQLLMDHEIDDIKKEYKESEKFKLNIRKIAKKAGLEDYYITNYWILSLSTHVSPISTEQYLTFIENDEYQFDISPKVDAGQVRFVISLAIDLLLRSLVELYQKYSIEQPDYLINLKERSFKI